MDPVETPAAPPPPASATPPPPAAAPPAATAPPETPPVAAPEPEDGSRVPYPKFREERMRANQAVQIARTQAAELTQARERLAAVEATAQERAQAAEDLRLLLGVINDHPDLRDAMKERMGGKLPRPLGVPVASQAGDGTTPPPTVKLDPETEKLIRENAQYARESRAQAEQERRQTADMQRYGALVSNVEGLLTARGLTPERVKRMAPIAIRDVVAQAAALPDGGSDADVPYLFNRWWAEIADFTQERTQAYVAGKVTDTRLPPAVPAGTPASAAPLTPALSDSASVRAQAAALLRSAGWGTGAGA